MSRPISDAEAKRRLNDFYATHPDVKAWVDKNKSKPHGFWDWLVVVSKTAKDITQTLRATRRALRNIYRLFGGR